MMIQVSWLSLSQGKVSSKVGFGGGLDWLEPCCSLRQCWTLGGVGAHAIRPQAGTTRSPPEAGPSVCLELDPSPVAQPVLGTMRGLIH